MYHTIQNTAENNVTRITAIIRFQSPDVSGLDSSAAFFSLATNSLWSCLNGFFPASPRALPLKMNHTASMNKKIAQIKNTVLKLNLSPPSPVVAVIARNVVPMKEPILTKEY